MSKRNAPCSADIPACACFAHGDPKNPALAWQGPAWVVKRLRHYAAMEQAFMARFIGGYTRGQICRYESGQTMPPLDFWLKLLLTFGLNLNWALTGKGKPYVIDFYHCPQQQRFIQWHRLKQEQRRLLLALEPPSGDEQ